MRETWRAAPGNEEVRLLLGAEWTPDSKRPLVPGLDYSVVRADGAGAPKTDPPELDPFPSYVGHLPASETASRGPWIDWAQEQNLGLEITPRPDEDGLDSGSLRRFAEANVPLFVTARASRPEELPRLLLALRLARRGWLGSTAVANTREAGTPTPRHVKDETR